MIYDCVPCVLWDHMRLGNKTTNLFAISLRFKNSFLSTMYTSLGANLTPKSFSETAPRVLVSLQFRCVVGHTIVACKLFTANKYNEF